VPAVLGSRLAAFRHCPPISTDLPPTARSGECAASSYFREKLLQFATSIQNASGIAV
jgi:hypothetical protein